MSNTGFLFPGQGAQFVGMGREVFDNHTVARELFDRADEVLGYPLTEVCFSGPEDRLHATDRSQPGLFVCSMASLEVLRQQHPETVSSCSHCAGLSLGEYSALCFSGAISFDDALRVVQARGDAMQQASAKSNGGMVAVLGLEGSQVRDLCEQSRQANEVLQIANLLCPGNIVCSGHRASCDALVQNAEQAGAMKVIPLTVAGAFHTSLMKDAVTLLRDALQAVTIVPPQVPVVFNVDASIHSDPDEVRKLLVQQVEQPVLWESSMKAMLDAGVNRCYEIGPGKVLRGLMKRIDRKLPMENVAC